MYRLERFPPPSHLADLTACDFLENQGRERRHRYYTLTGYLTFIRNENIDEAGRMSRYTSLDISQSGGFYSQPDHIFYKDSSALIKFEDEYKDKGKPNKSAPRKIGRPRKDDSKSPKGKSVTQETNTGSVGKPRGRRAKVVTMPQGGDDQGQPIGDKVAQKGTKRKRQEPPEPSTSNPAPRPPRKKRAIQESTAQSNDDFDITDVQVPEPSKDVGSGNIEVHFPEGTSSQGTVSKVKGSEFHMASEETYIEELALGLPSTTLNPAHTNQVHSLPDHPALMSGVAYSMSKSNPDSQQLPSSSRVAPCENDHLVSPCTSFIYCI